MFTIGQTIDVKAAKRLYVTTRNAQEIGMYRQGMLSPVYYLTANQVVVGVFTDRSEADKKLGDLLDGLDFAEEHCCKIS